MFSEDGHQTRRAALNALKYMSSIDELKTLEHFAMEFLFSEAVEAELTGAGDNELNLLLQNKRRILSGFCKLCFSDILPVLRAAFIFQYYEQVSSPSLPFLPCLSRIHADDHLFTFAVQSVLRGYYTRHHGALHAQQHN